MRKRHINESASKICLWGLKLTSDIQEDGMPCNAIDVFFAENWIRAHMQTSSNLGIRD
jgi:hypothetical protein